MNIITPVTICRKCVRDGIEPQSQRHLVTTEAKTICCRCGLYLEGGAELVIANDVAPILSDLLLNCMFEVVSVKSDNELDPATGNLRPQNELVLRNKQQPDLACVLTWYKKDLIHPPEVLPRWNTDFTFPMSPLADKVVRKIVDKLPQSDNPTLGIHDFGNRLKFRNVFRRSFGYADLFVIVGAEISWN